jgi:hypothetical protein
MKYWNIDILSTDSGLDAWFTCRCIDIPRVKSQDRGEQIVIICKGEN